MLDITLILVAVLAVAAAGVVLYASTKPDSFHFARSMEISAPPERVFGLIHDLRAMNTWNPFVLNAPDQKGSYSGTAIGPGSAYDFEGKRSGSGRIEIIGEAPYRKVEMRLLMTRPMACDNRVSFTIEPHSPPGGTASSAAKVTWAMSGRTSLPGKVFSLFFCSEDMLGKPFDEGLTNLKRIAEKS